MGFLAKNEVLTTIKMRTQKGGYAIYEAYLGTDPFTGKPVRKSASSEKKLKLKIINFYKTLDSSGAAGITLTHFQAMDAKQAIDMIAQSGQDLSLVECAKIALSNNQAHNGCCSMPIGMAYNNYFESVKDKSEFYKKDVRLRVGSWVSAFGSDRDIGEVSAPEVKQYLMAKYYRSSDPCSWVTYNGVLANIKTFLLWCAGIEQKYIKESPLEGMKKITIPYRQPEYMKPEDVNNLFLELWNHRETPIGKSDLAYAILSFFCGMRQSEIERVPLGEHAVKINMEERSIRVGIPKGVSKGIKPRAFTIPEQACVWMLAFDFMTGAKTRNTQFRRHLTEAAETAKVHLPKNAGRHTFITMFEAVYHDANALTAIVGNTDDVRSKNYNGVEMAPVGRAYFAIMPPAI